MDQRRCRRPFEALVSIGPALLRPACPAVAGAAREQAAVRLRQQQRMRAGSAGRLKQEIGLPIAVEITRDQLVLIPRPRDTESVLADALADCLDEAYGTTGRVVVREQDIAVRGGRRLQQDVRLAVTVEVGDDSAIVA